MPTAVMGIASVIATAAAGVGSAVAGIASAISAVVGGVVSTIGGIVGSTIGTIGTAVAGITSMLSSVGYYFTKGLSFNLASIGNSIASTAANISSALSGAIKVVTVPMTKVVSYTKKEFIGRVVTLYETIDNVAYPILNPIKETLQTVKTAVDMIKEPVDTIMEPVQELRKVISDVSSLKIIGDVMAGTVKISDLLGDVAEGKSVETARVISELTKSIATTTVATMDKIDVEFEMLGATIDTFDERIKTSVAEKVAISKAEILAKMTPRLDQLGKYQAKVISGIARLTRHIEDEQWFAFMFLRALS